MAGQGRFSVALTRAILKYRRLLIVTFQISLAIFGALFSFFIRFDFMPSSAELHWLSGFVLICLAVKLPLIQYFDLNRGWWRYISTSDLISIAKLSAVALVLIAILSQIFLTGYSRGVLAIDWAFTILLLGGSRFGMRLLRERRERSRDGFLPSHLARRVLVVGAGLAGVGLVRHLQHNPMIGVEIVGLIDDDPHKRGTHFFGLEVLGGIDDLAHICLEQSIHEVLISIPSLKKSRMKAIVDQSAQAKVLVKTMPSIREILSGERHFQLRQVRVEDLLGREPIRLNHDRVAQELAGQTILISGAGGSIGSEICRQVLRFGPRALVLFERSEANLFYIEQELRQILPPDVELHAVIGDLLDKEVLHATFAKYRPELVYHAAAYKHVPLMEDNPRAAVCNNVLGTLALADAALASGTKKFVNISTDKAVNPLNTMGYSKRMAELVVQGKAGRGCEFISVRFGNVLGSSGSVVEIFRRQIEAGRNLTVTDPNVTRFFMTTPEAVELVLHAGAHGESGEIYMLDMGQPVKITLLAEAMIRLADPEGRKGLSIDFIGLRKGEKLAEELVWEGEDFVPAPVRSVFRFKHKRSARRLEEALADLRAKLNNPHLDMAKELKFWVDEIDRQTQGLDPLKNHLLLDTLKPSGDLIREASL